MTTRTVLVIAHTGRDEACELTTAAITEFRAAGVQVRLLADEAAELGLRGLEDVEQVFVGHASTSDCDLVVVIGGDGTILRAAELARPTGTPVLGVNLGHVGFLAEVEKDDMSVIVDAVVTQSYQVEERMTLDVSVTQDGVVVTNGWALNETSVEKGAGVRMLDLVAEIDGHILSRWGCDGVVMATPTGSTAYAFSAGGPVVWPGLGALLMVPISAHALFTRPLVVTPDSTLSVTVQPDTDPAVLWCDGRRIVDLPAGSRVDAKRGEHPVRLARLHTAPFTDRLVGKFALPVQGWRAARAERDNDMADG